MTGDPEYDWYVFAVIGMLMLCSFLTRCGYYLFGDYLPLREPVRRALRYAPTAALVGIIVPELLPWQQGAGPTLDLKAAAALIALLVYWRTRSTLLVIVGGMAAYWLLDFLF